MVWRDEKVMDEGRREGRKKTEMESEGERG